MNWRKNCIKNKQKYLVEKLIKSIEHEFKLALIT